MSRVNPIWVLDSFWRKFCERVNYIFYYYYLYKTRQPKCYLNMKYQQHKNEKCTCVFFTIADLSIYLYLTYCKPWQSINMNVVPPLPWEMSNINSKFMIVFILENLYMCRRWIPRWNLRLPIQIPRHKCRMIFANYRAS